MQAAALNGWRLLHNGMGGIDWAGLPMVVELLGVEDVELFVLSVMTLRGHKPDKDE